MSQPVQDFYRRRFVVLVGENPVAHVRLLTDLFGVRRQVLVVIESRRPLALDRPHLFGVVVVVRQRAVDVGDVEVVAFCDRSRFESTALDTFPDELHRNPTLRDVGLVAQLPHDTGLLSAHHTVIWCGTG